MAYEILDGTTTGFTGGTSETYEEVPSSAKTGKHYVNIDAGSGITRESVHITTRASRVNSDGTVVKRKTSLTLTVPVEDATTGEIRYNTIRVELSTDPRDESLVAEMREKAAQLAASSAFDNALLYGVE